MPRRRPVRLPVWTRTIQGDRDRLTIEKSVPCPVNGLLPIDVCTRCEQLDRFGYDPDGRQCCVCRPQVAPPTWWSRLTRSSRAAADATPVSSAMRANVRCVTCDFSARALIRLFTESPVGTVPVVDYESCAIGVVTRADLAMAQRYVSVSVAELMAPPPIVHKSESITQAMARLAAAKQRDLIVVDEEERVVGLLSAPDVTRWLEANR